MMHDNSPFMLFYGKILSILPRASVLRDLPLSCPNNDYCMSDKLADHSRAGPGAMTFPTGWLELFVAPSGSGARLAKLSI